MQEFPQWLETGLQKKTLRLRVWSGHGQNEMNETKGTSWWFQVFSIFTLTWGNDEQKLPNMFQLGWFNHHLGDIDDSLQLLN